MAMIRKMEVISMLNNVMFMSEHIPGKHNIVADLLSQFQTANVKKVASWLDEVASKVPSNLLPWCLSQQK